MPSKFQLKATNVIYQKKLIIFFFLAFLARKLDSILVPDLNYSKFSDKLRLGLSAFPNNSLLIESRN